MDEALLARAQAGDRQALEQVLGEIAPLVQRFGLRMCKHPTDAEDVLQDTLLSIAVHLPEFQGRSSLSSWVFTLARSACTRMRRGLKNHPHLAEDTVRHLTAEGDSPEEAAHDKELRLALERALGALSEEHREILLLRDMEDLSAAEVSEVLGLGVPAIKSRLHRARGALREQLKAVLERNAPPAGSDCPDVLAAFSAKLEGDLAAEDCRSMEEHVSHCSACAAACSALKRALWACRMTPHGQVPDEVKERVSAALRAFEQQRAESG
jgi:RNA polymerase sigma-70 factor (ECF subfamily)